MRDRNQLTAFRLNERLMDAVRAKAVREGTTATAVVRVVLHREFGIAA